MTPNMLTSVSHVLSNIIMSCFDGIFTSTVTRFIHRILSCSTQHEMLQHNAISHFSSNIFIENCSAQRHWLPNWRHNLCTVYCFLITALCFHRCSCITNRSLVLWSVCSLMVVYTMSATRLIPFYCCSTGAVPSSITIPSATTAASSKTTKILWWTWYAAQDEYGPKCLISILQ